VLGQKICSWLLLFQEYDFEVIVKPGRLNAGPYHLSRIEIGEEPSSLEEGLPNAHLFVVCLMDHHFSDVIQFLTTVIALEGYYTQQKKELVVCGAYFLVIEGHWYKMGIDKILQRYVPEFECASILTEAHGRVAGGHYARKQAKQKILCARLWWLTLHRDSKAYCKACDACQWMGKPSRRDEFPLNPQVSLQVFDKWVIDFIGPIQLAGKKTGA